MGPGSVEFDLEAVMAASRNIAGIAGVFPQIQQRAIGTLRRRLPVEARRDIQREYNVPAARIGEDLSIRDTGAGLVLVGKFRGMGLTNFGARQTSSGVTASVFRGRRSLRPSAFIATLRGGNRQVVQRVGRERLPIKTLYGPSVAQMLRKDGRPERLADFAAETLRKEAERLMAYYTAGTTTPTEE